MKAYTCEECDSGRKAKWAIKNDSGGEYLYCDECKNDMVRKLTPDEMMPKEEPRRG